MITVYMPQPGYLPWHGFFNRCMRSDVVVLYDLAQFVRRDVFHRNKIKLPNGNSHWLTVPVRHPSNVKQQIVDVEIDNELRWVRKHLGSIRVAYLHTPYFNEYYPALERLLLQEWCTLAGLNMHLIRLIFDWLNIESKVILTSDLQHEIDYTQERSQKLVDTCRVLGANRYLTSAHMQGKIDLDLFAKYSIEVVWSTFTEANHPIYPQIHGKFIPFLSSVDMMFNCGGTYAKDLIWAMEK